MRQYFLNGVKILKEELSVKFGLVSTAESEDDAEGTLHHRHHVEPRGRLCVPKV